MKIDNYIICYDKICILIAHINAELSFFEILRQKRLSQ